MSDDGDCCYPIRDTPPPDAQAMTREQVEKVVRHHTIGWGPYSKVNPLLERDAARQDVARLRIVIKTILFQVAQGKVLERDACISEAKRVYEDTKPT